MSKGRKKKKRQNNRIDVTDVEQALSRKRQLKNAKSAVKSAKNSALFVKDSGSTELSRVERRRRAREERSTIDKLLETGKGAPHIKDAKTISKADAVKAFNKTIDSTVSLMKRQEQAESVRPPSPTKEDMLEDWSSYVQDEKPQSKRVKRFLEARKPEKSSHSATSMPKDEESYNPDRKLHAKLVKKIVSSEIKFAKRQRLAMEKASHPVARRLVEEQEQLALESGAAPYFPQSDNDSDDEPRRVRKFPIPKPKKKIGVMKKIRKIEYGLMMKEKQRRKRQRAQIDKVRSILKVIEEEQVEREKSRKEELDNKQRAREMTPRRLGKYRYQNDPIPVLLQKDLPENLRSLQSVVEPVRDRFKNLQKRNFFEVRMKRTKDDYKAPRRKKFERRSVKAEDNLL